MSVCCLQEIYLYRKGICEKIETVKNATIKDKKEGNRNDASSICTL